MLEKIKRNYAVEVLRRLESQRYDTKDLAEQYFGIVYDTLKTDLVGINVTPKYEEVDVITVTGQNRGRRHKVWEISIDMEQVIVKKF